MTGGSRGIGAAICKLFAEEGARVVSIAKTEKRPDWLCDGDADAFNNIEYRSCDVTDPRAVRSLLTDMKQQHGTVDVLVNNAGIEFDGLLAATSEDQMRAMFEVNVFGTVFMTQYAVRIMQQRKTEGSIVNISSGVGVTGHAGQSVYAATKGAVISFTKSAAKELAPLGIRVNSVAPGLTDTGMLANTDERDIAKRIAAIPFGRLARPDEIAQACLFLASDEASYISGQVLQVDGSAVI